MIPPIAGAECAGAAARFANLWFADLEATSDEVEVASLLDIALAPVAPALVLCAVSVRASDVRSSALCCVPCGAAGADADIPPDGAPELASCSFASLSVSAVFDGCGVATFDSIANLRLELAMAAPPALGAAAGF